MNGRQNDRMKGGHSGESGMLPPGVDERMREGDPYYNYCLWEYPPPVSGIGKLRPSALLFYVVEQMEEAGWIRDTLRRLQETLGAFRSVYGIKQTAGQWALEIYLYDYEREDRAVSVDRLNRVMDGWLELPFVDSRVPYFMFSFDLDAATALAGGAIETVHIYVGNPGSAVSSGISYGFRRPPSVPRLENFYFFFRGDDHRAIREKLLCSAYLTSVERLESRLYPEYLRDCHTVCLANKQTGNTVYFSGVRIEQLCEFLCREEYPENFTEWVRANRGQLDHLLYDVGLDYSMVGEQLVVTKSGVYGVF